MEASLTVSSFYLNTKDRLAMDNSSSIQEYKQTIQFLLCTVPPSGKKGYFVSAMYALFSITATLGNTLILVALHKETSLHPPSKLLYRCLAMTDLLVGLILQPSKASLAALLVKEHRPTDLCLCIIRITVVSFTTLSAVSLLTMTTISVDRLLALLTCLRHRQIVALRRVRALVALFWIVSLGFAVATIWQYPLGKRYNLTLISLCILISSLCYFKIFFTLRRNQIQAQQQQGQPNGGGIPLNIARYQKTVATAIWVEVTLIACYLPYAIVIAIVTTHGSSPFLDGIWEITVFLVSLNSSLNPLLYCWRIKTVKQEVKNTVRQFLCLSN